MAEAAVLTRELAERQRATLEELELSACFEEVELPLVDVLVEMEREGVKLDVPQVREIATRIGDEAAELEREIWELAGRSSRSARPSSSARSCSRSWGCRASAAARRASPPTPACSRPSATSTRSSARSRSGAS